MYSKGQQKHNKESCIEEKIGKRLRKLYPSSKQIVKFSCSLNYQQAINEHSLQYLFCLHPFPAVSLSNSLSLSVTNQIWPLTYCVFRVCRQSCCVAGNQPVFVIHLNRLHTCCDPSRAKIIKNINSSLQDLHTVKLDF